MEEKKFFQRLIIIVFLIIGLETIFANGALATELLTNGNMETGSPPSNWTKYGLESFTAETTIVHRGSQSAKLVENNTTVGYIKSDGISGIVAERAYTCTGYIYDNTTSAQGYIKVFWYASTDGTGTAISSVQVGDNTSDSNEWQYRKGTFTAPPAAQSARIFCYNKALEAPWGPIYYDDLSLTRTNVKINEVLYDPEGVDTGKEWIELVNNGEYDIYIGGWDLDPDGLGYYEIPASSGTWDGTLDAGSFVVIHVRASGTDTATDLYHSSPTTNMGNTSGHVTLYTHTTTHTKDTIIDFMEYGTGGETGEATAVNAGIWKTGAYTPDVDETHSIGLYADGNDPEDNPDGNCGKLHDDATYPGNWDDFSSPTPRESNNPSTIKIIIQKWRELYH